MSDCFPDYKRTIRPEEFRAAFINAVKPYRIHQIEVAGQLDPACLPGDSSSSTYTRTFRFEATFFGSQMGLAHFTLTSLPGCGGVLVSSNSWVAHSLRNQGFGDLMQFMKNWVAGHLEVGKLVATVVQGNKAEEHLLLKHGWTPGQPFWNPHTSNRVREWERLLR